MEPYTISIIVTQQDLDDLNHVNNVIYVKWMQDIAKEHWQSKAPEKIIKSTAWVVLSHNIKYKGAATLGDTILLKTYIIKSKGAVCVRVVEMHNKDTDQLLIHSETEWCLLNSSNMRPIRISKEIENVFI